MPNGNTFGNIRIANYFFGVSRDSCGAISRGFPTLRADLLDANESTWAFVQIGSVGGYAKSQGQVLTLTKQYDRRVRVIVTGGNSGVGRETAAALAAAGHRVVIACRTIRQSRAAVDLDEATTGNRKKQPCAHSHHRPRIRGRPGGGRQAAGRHREDRGPEKISFEQMARDVLARQGQAKAVIVDPQVAYFGTPLSMNSLVIP